MLLCFTLYKLPANHANLREFRLSIRNRFISFASMRVIRVQNLTRNDRLHKCFRLQRLCDRLRLKPFDKQLS